MEVAGRVIGRVSLRISLSQGVSTKVESDSCSEIIGARKIHIGAIPNRTRVLVEHVEGRVGSTRLNTVSSLTGTR